MNRSSTSPVRPSPPKTRPTGHLQPASAAGQPTTPAFSDSLPRPPGLQPTGDHEHIPLDQPLPDATSTAAQGLDAPLVLEATPTDHMVELANAHLAIGHPAARLELMDRLTDLVPELQTLVEVEALLVVIDAAQPTTPHLPLYEALFARVAQLALSAPDTCYRDVTAHLPDLIGAPPAVVRSQYLTSLLERLDKALRPLGPTERLIAVKAYLAVALEDTAPFPKSCIVLLLAALPQLPCGSPVACAIEEALYIHLSRDARLGRSVDRADARPIRLPASVADTPNGPVSWLTDLPGEVTETIMNLLNPDPFAVADHAGTAARIAALGRLSQVNHRFHEQLKDALRLALFSAFQLPSLALKAWRSNDPTRPAAIVQLYLALNPSASPVQCLQWLVAGALLQRTPLECTRALNLVREIGTELQRGSALPAVRAAVARHLPVLLVQAVLKGLADTRVQTGRWILTAKELLGWLSTLPREQATPALLEMLTLFTEPGQVTRSISGDILDEEAELRVEEVVAELHWPIHVATVLFNQMVCVNEVAIADDTDPDARVIDAALAALSAHSGAFVGVMARALIALERMPLTDTQSALLAQCLKTADARGPWRAFA